MILDGKVAIVTGAGSGIGEGIALRFAKEGAKVVVAEMDEGKGRATAGKIEKAGGDALVVATNVARVRDVEAMVDRAVERFGSIHILVNNAGIRHAAPIVEMTDEQWQSTLNTNLSGGFYCLRRVARQMIDSGVAGAVVNVASVAGMRGIQNRAAYCATKAGLMLLTKTAALELAPHGIRVNAIAPGLIETPLTMQYARPLDADSRMMADKIVATIPLRRWGQPADVAAAAVYLVSDEATYVTGATLIVDPGLSAG